jgi:hypothetical protein
VWVAWGRSPPVDSWIYSSQYLLGGYRLYHRVMVIQYMVLLLLHYPEGTPVPPLPILLVILDTTPWRPTTVRYPPPTRGTSLCVSFLLST